MRRKQNMRINRQQTLQILHHMNPENCAQFDFICKCCFRDWTMTCQDKTLNAINSAKKNIVKRKNHIESSTLQTGHNFSLQNSVQISLSIKK